MWLGLCGLVVLFVSGLVCSLTVAEARKGYVGGAPVVLAACGGDAVCVLVRWFGWCLDLVLSVVVGADFWLLCPWLGWDLGIVLGLAADVFFGCVDSLFLDCLWDLVLSPRGWPGFVLIWLGPGVCLFGWCPFGGLAG